jgi:hypothetical protein
VWPAFWWIVLLGSLGSVAAGFAGGRSIGGAAVATLHPRPATLPSPVKLRTFERALHGAHSFDAAADPRDAYDASDVAVAPREPGWASAPFDERDRARVVLLVVDAGIAGAPADAFIRSPLPFGIVVPAGGNDGGAGHAARARGKDVLIDAHDALPAQIAAARRRGALGIVGSFETDAAADVAVAAAGRGAFAIDMLLTGDAALYRRARAHGLAAVTRDVIVDARDTDPFLDEMFGVVLALARRTGVAVVALHARPHTLDAAERFALRAARDGVDVVPPSALAAGVSGGS